MEEVKDSVLCTMSCVLICNKRFVENEFMSHVNLTDFVSSHNVFEQENTASNVRSIVHNLLCSEMLKTLYFWSVILHMNSSRLKLTNTENIALTCVELMVDCIHMLKLTQFNVATRNNIVKPVSQCILRVMNMIVHNFRMPLKEGELRVCVVYWYSI